MDWLTVSNVTLVLSLLFLAHGIYLIVGILMSKPQTATIVGYDEVDSYDPNTGTTDHSLVPIYTYRTPDGEIKTKRSHYALFFSWLKKDTMRVYVDKYGKTYEPAGVVSSLIAAVLLFLIG